MKPNNLLRLQVIDRVHGGYSPTLDDDREYDYCADYKEGEWEYPPMDGGALCKVLEPTAADVVGCRGGYDK